MSVVLLQISSAEIAMSRYARSTSGKWAYARLAREWEEKWSELEWEFSEPVNVCSVNIPYIIEAVIDHCKPFQPKPPCHHWFLEAKRPCDFGPEYSRTTKFHLLAVYLHHHIQAWFSIWVIGRGVR